MGRLHIHLYLAFADDGMGKLADLITLGQVGIEVVLAVEARPGVDSGLETQPRPNSLFDAATIDHGQHARHGCIHKRYVGIWVRPVVCGRAGKQLGTRRDLGMDLQTHHQFPFPGVAVDCVGRTGVAHGAAPCGSEWRPDVPALQQLELIPPRPLACRAPSRCASPPSTKA